MSSAHAILRNPCGVSEFETYESAAKLAPLDKAKTLIRKVIMAFLADCLDMFKLYEIHQNWGMEPKTSVVILKINKLCLVCRATSFSRNSTETSKPVNIARL